MQGLSVETAATDGNTSLQIFGSKMEEGPLGKLLNIYTVTQQYLPILLQITSLKIMCGSVLLKGKSRKCT
jgi:hypothetical protein